MIIVRRDCRPPAGKRRCALAALQGLASKLRIAASLVPTFGAETNKRLRAGTQIDVAAPGALATLIIGVYRSASFWV